MASIPSDSRRLKSSKKVKRKKRRRIGKKKINLSKWIHDRDLLTAARNRLIEKCQRYSIVATDPLAAHAQSSARSRVEIQNSSLSNDDNPFVQEGVERMPMSSKLSQSVERGSHLKYKDHTPNDVAKSEDDEKSEVVNPETTYEGEDEANGDEHAEKLPALSPSPMHDISEGLAIEKQINMESLTQLLLVSVGSRNACIRALMVHPNDLNEAANWIIEHQWDANIDSYPFSVSAQTQIQSQTQGQSVSSSSTSTPSSVSKHDAKRTTKAPGPIFDSVNRMEMSMHIKGSKLEETLCRFERCLISKKAKKSIPRHCLFCKKCAPKKYPKDVYICNDHRKGLAKELEEHEIVIPTKECTKEAKENCITLKESYQQILKSLKTEDLKPDRSMFPKNYFSTTMAKLLHCQRTLDALSPDQVKAAKVRNQTKRMKKIVKQLMDLLIVIRQSMNPIWVWICALITTIASIIAGSVAWMIAQNAFITVLAGLLTFFVGVMIGGVICGDEKLKFLCGSGAVGAAGGVVAGGVGAALLVTKEGSEIGAMIGTACGGPGAGTAAGALVGGLVGGVFGMGAAAMYTYWPGQESEYEYEDDDEDEDDYDTEPGAENALLNEQNYF